MRTLSNVYNTIRKLRSLTGNAINTHLTTSERLILADLQSMGLLTGGLS